MDNGLEYRLCAMLSDVLSIRRVSSEDSFFELGGDSLSAVRFFEGIEKDFEVTLPVSTILEHPTVGDIARVIRERGSKSLLSRMYRYRSGGLGSKFFCAHGNLSQLFKFLHPEQSVYVLTPHGLDGFAAPHSVPEMAADYLAEIQTVQKEGPYCLGGYSFGGLIILEVAVMLQQMGHRVAFLGILDTRFDITYGERDKLINELYASVDEQYRAVADQLEMLADNRTGRQALATKVVGMLNHLYEAEDYNPLRVFLAYQLCRHVELKIPEWIHKYFDGVANIVLNNNDTSSRELCAQALQLDRWDYEKQAKSEHEMEIARNVWEFVQKENKLALDPLYNKVADHYEISKSAVRDYFLKYKNALQFWYDF